MPPIGASRIASNFITAPDVIPDSVEYQFVASSGTDGGDWTSEDGSVTMPAGGSPTHQSGPNGETVYYYDGAGDSHGPATITTISQPTAIVGVLRYAPTGQNNARALGATDNDDPYHFTAPDGPNDGYTMYAGSYIGASNTHDTNWHIHSGLFDGQNSVNRLDGSTDVTGDAGTNDLTTLRVALYPSGPNFTELEVAEFWIFDNPSIEDVATCEDILNDKYGVF